MELKKEEAPFKVAIEAITIKLPIVKLIANFAGRTTN